MLECEEFFQVLQKEGFTYFTGVPDSTFKDWMSFLDEAHGEILTNRIAAIERDAVGWAAGYHVATGKIGTVYMQNSGLGNTVNPLTSLADPEIYAIPMLLMIGWRGEPGVHDEPQHLKMGQITLPLLELMQIEYCVLPTDLEDAKRAIEAASEHMKKNGRTYALVIRKNTFAPYVKKRYGNDAVQMKREKAIMLLADLMESDEIIVSTTGKTSRELFELRENTGSTHDSDFLMVGSMGCASSFGAEIAIQHPEKTVTIFDGDGALIMSEGVLSTIGYYSPENLFHVVFDNGCHESTGGQPTTSIALDYILLAEAHKYRSVRIAENEEELVKSYKHLKKKKGPKMLVVRVEKGSRSDLGRPTKKPNENKRTFMERLLKR